MKTCTCQQAAEPRIDILKIFAEDRVEDKEMVMYRPKLRRFTGSVTATILLQQIFLIWNNGQKPFYKFKGPCSHKLYKPGDSWVEELGFSRIEFDNALKKIGFKRSRKNSTKHNFPVEYWITPSRETYYTIHVENFRKCLSELY